MRYSLRHVTTYRYASPVTFAQCTLVLTPTTDAGQQVANAVLVITPKPKTVAQHRSFFGHPVTVASFNVPHTVLRIEARAEISVNRSTRVRPSAPDTAWEWVRAAAQSQPSLKPDAPAHFLFPSARILLAPSVTAYARRSFAAERNIVASVDDLMTRIRTDFRYDPDATRVSTPLIEAFEKRHGVCQEFAHIMIAGLRGLGLPARYVSGYIRTIAPPGEARLEGADATHAWVDVWCGPDRGWIGFDPTNAIRVGDDHVVLATGRDYGDVAPVGGILLGTGEQEIEVNVDLVPLEAA